MKIFREGGSIGARSAMMRDQHHQEQDYHRDHGQGTVIEDFAGKLGFSLLPIPQLGTVFDADLVKVGQIPGKFVSFGISVSGIALQGAV